MPSSQIVLEEFQSKVLEGNPLGDPTRRRVPVYLPPDFDEGELYPTVFLLSGFGSRGLKFLNDDLWEENLQQMLDRLISSGQIRPLIAMFPDCSTRYGGSQFLNSSATGNYQDYLLELVGFIDGKYPTRADAACRAVAGHSSGGFGSLWMGMLHSELFGLVACHSGDSGFELVYKPDFGTLLRYIERIGEDGLKEFLRNPGPALRAGAPHLAIDSLAMASVYSPNPKARLGFDLPFDLHTGQIREEIWKKWLAHDPINAIEKHVASLRALKLLYIDCGRFDEYNLVYSARQLHEKLSAAKIPHQYEEHEGTHRDAKLRYENSLKAISATFPD